MGEDKRRSSREIWDKEQSDVKGKKVALAEPTVEATHGKARKSSKGGEMVYLVCR